MPTLTYNEGEVIMVLRRLAAERTREEPDSPPWVPVALIRSVAFNNHRIRYDSTHRALRGLVDKGAAIKPARGFYLPVPMNYSVKET